jgi:hypothetical protein
MSAAYSEIARVLSGARRRQARAIALAALGFGAAGVLAALLLGASALALGARIGLRPLALGLAAAAAAAAVGWAVRATLRTAWSEEAAARTVARSQPALRSDLLSSIELVRARADIARTGDYSLALVDGHVERTAERARGVDLATAVPGRAVRLGGLALLGVAAVHGVAFLLGGGGLARAYGRVLAGDPAGALAADTEPITGDVELTYRYPSYTRREPRTVSGTGGEIRAPRGTEVELRTRADRPVKAAELAVVGAEAGVAAPGRVALVVTGERDLSGRLLLDAAGTYRFRFLDGRGNAVAEGPSIPITVEADDAPDVRIIAPERELEVDPGAVVRIAWTADDDVGLSEVALVVKAPGAPERREVLRKPEGVRRERGERLLDLAPERLSEGESLVYWVEALDGDTISGPKKGSSETQTLRIYSEAEHRRKVMEQARRILDEMVVLLADRLETLDAGSLSTPERLPLAQALDQRARGLHQRMREVARDIRRDRAGPPAVAAALSNVAGALVGPERRLSALHERVASLLRQRIRPDQGLVRTLGAADGQLDAELEKGILYLEQLLDEQRAEDLLRLAKDLAARRRELADLLESYRKAPGEEARAQVQAQVQRMKERLKELLAQMAELARGFQDEHMNAEALAEMERSQDLLGGLDEVERKLAQGDVEGAMKALDQMASTMDRMMAGLERTAGRPAEQNAELMKQMLAFKDALAKVKDDQERTAAETEKIRSEYRKKLAERLKGAERELSRLEKLAGEARHEVEQAQPGVPPRAEPEYEMARESLSNLERALAMKDLGTAHETAQRAAPSTARLSQYLEEEARLAQDGVFPPGAPAGRAAEAHQRVEQAVPRAREVRDALAKLFPDPREVLGQDAQRQLDRLARRQAELERQAGGLQQSLAQLMQQAPIFPPEAQQQLGESRGHMGQAAAELGARNPQRGHGEQELALDALNRFQQGLEEAARRGQGGGGQGFPFPFAQSGGAEEGEGRDPSRERVEIPGAEAHKVPEEFRKDLLEAMKQGAPERYRADVQRYYEELVK